MPEPPKTSTIIVLSSIKLLCFKYGISITLIYLIYLFLLPMNGKGGFLKHLLVYKYLLTLIFKNPTKQDILLDLLKINRAIYYQLKTFTDGQIVKSIAALQTQGMKDKLKLSKIKKDIKNANQTVGKGISDDYDVDMLKNVNYNQLKEIMEK